MTKQQVRVTNRASELSKEGYKVVFVGTCTQGIATKEFVGESWKEVFDKMWDSNYIIEDTNLDCVHIEDLDTEESYKQYILEWNDAFYYDYRETGKQLKQYKVEVNEEYSGEVIVTANSEDEAYEIANKMAFNQEVTMECIDKQIFVKGEVENV